MIIKYINEKEREFNLKEIDINNFHSLSQIYSFTTENIAGYFEYIDFANKKILTVSASGDHIINAFYKGAESVIAFDINYLALIFTELKLVALEQLEYEEFLQFFMINEKNNIVKNKNALNYAIYKDKLKKYLSKNVVKNWDMIYQTFNNDGYKLRNSYIFNNKYDNNDIKINSNLYLKSKIDYNIAKEKIREKEIMLINSNYKDINYHDLPNLANCDIILMSNISDYIKNLYNKNYLEEYIKEITYNFKMQNNKIVCAYLYNIQSNEYRSEIDNPIIRKNVFNKLDITYIEKTFKSVMDNCIDSVIII
jgi:hypothetical protein